MLESAAGLDLREVTVRRITDRAETARWDLLMERHHYLGFRGLVGGGVRQVAEAPDGRWLALLGWHAGSFKVGVRDRWIGWTREQQFRRLRLVANNTRFLVLPGVAIPNLASRVLGFGAAAPVWRHAGAGRPSGPAGGDVRRSEPICGHVLSGVEKARARQDAGLCAGFGGLMASARFAEDGVGAGVVAGRPGGSQGG